MLFNGFILGIDSSAPLIQWFWEVMEEFTNQERSLFLRFVWGRTRLPRTIADFRGRDFVIQILDKYTPPDHFLPESYTCFFLLKMPRYSCKVSENFISSPGKIKNGSTRNKFESRTKNKMWKVFMEFLMLLVGF